MSCDFISLASSGIQSLQPYQPGKPVETLERELGITNVVKLASNENPLGPSPKVIAALAENLTDLARYPDGSAYNLKQTLAGYHNIGADMLTIGNGSNDVLELLARVFLRPDNEAIVSQHSFVVYPLATKSLGAGLKIIPAKDYGQDLAATLKAISSKTRMIFIANPNNPTGTWIDKKTLCDFLNQVREDILVILDEAYFDYVDEADYPDGIELVRQYPNLVVTRTFSKAYGLAALRIGYGISHPDIADLMNRVRQPFNVNAMSLIAAEIALADREHVAASVKLNREGMTYLTAECEQLGLDYIPSVGNFLTIDMGREAMPIYDALLQLGVIVRPIGVYEMPNHLRVTIGSQAENTRFIDSLKRVIG